MTEMNAASANMIHHAPPQARSYKFATCVRSKAVVNLSIAHCRFIVLPLLCRYALAVPAQTLYTDQYVVPAMLCNLVYVCMLIHGMQDCRHVDVLILRSSVWSLLENILAERLTSGTGTC